MKVKVWREITRVTATPRCSTLKLSCGHETIRSRSQVVPKIKVRCGQCEKLWGGGESTHFHPDGSKTIETWNDKTQMPIRKKVKK